METDDHSRIPSSLEGHKMIQSKLLDAALHEAAHLVVYVKAGGMAGGVVSVRISHSGDGGIFTPDIHRLRDPMVADAAITAAGIACEHIRGIEPHEGKGSDTDRLHDILWNSADEQIVISKTRQWLETEWQHVEWVAQRLVDAPKRRGIVSHRIVREIVEELACRLVVSKKKGVCRQRNSQ